VVSLFDCTLRARRRAPVQRLVFEMPSGFSFRPGQYVEIVHPAGTIPLSIASAPWRLPELHLHYRSTPGVPEAAWMDELLDHGTAFTISGPSGTVLLPEPVDRPLLLVAGGTGIAQVHALLDALVRQPPTQPVTVLWLVDQPADLYCRAELEALDAPWLQLHCNADSRRDATNPGLRTLRELAERARTAPVPPWIMLSGSPGFVHTAFRILRAAGVAAAHVHADVFAWAPDAAGDLHAEAAGELHAEAAGELRAEAAGELRAEAAGELRADPPG
jgi:CDP-4-dehydro-6-deoxyglucose reductase